ncbi:hypothetical protein LMG27177_02531 [Paraburkholderia fynbosensis]|uniref:Uncharacterized protein n=1 Tax=Paraburkholderia fynbosensis TaxID=1200993 RepID=A0A6J5FXZ3_9BURK|nr:hypothetical protein LMG27177_02531 [Paraburkholderia fynbosensis]
MRVKNDWFSGAAAACDDAGFIQPFVKFASIVYRK